MALQKGSRRCYEWLKTKAAGDVVPRQEVLDASGWSEVSLTTYFKKNKLAPFLLRLDGDDVKVLQDGTQLSEGYFDEVFTQTAPSKVLLAPGDKLAGKSKSYKLIEPLGNGAIGHVWSARVDGGDKGIELVAVKVMLPREDLLADSKIVDVRERFRREALNGALLGHKNLVRYLDHGEVQKNPFLVMELASSSVGRMLASGPLASNDAAAVVRDVVDGLEHLHESKCPHRDVKPDNMLVFEDSYKLADLGIVKWTDFDRRFTTGATLTRASMQLGSWFYMAPEQQQDAHEAVFASDVYALGVSWIEMLSGSVPSPHALGAQAYPQPCEDDEVCSLLKRMVSYAPADRPSLSEIREVASKRCES